MTEKTMYVVSYIFNHDNTEVLLLKKKRPEFLAGKMTGIGGHVEKSDESIYHAIQREILEESNISIDTYQSFLLYSAETSDYVLDIFVTVISEEQRKDFKNNIDEEQEWFKIEDIKNNNLDLIYAPHTLYSINYIHNNSEIFKNHK